MNFQFTKFVFFKKNETKVTRGSGTSSMTSSDDDKETPVLSGNGGRSLCFVSCLSGNGGGSVFDSSSPLNADATLCATPYTRERE